MPTLVPLFLGLYSHRQILARQPVNLFTLGVVVDEVTTVATLSLVKVRLGKDGVAEVFVARKLEDETEPRLVEILHANVDETLEDSLVPVGDDFRERDVVLEGRQPELRDTGHVLGRGAFLVIVSRSGGCLRLGGALLLGGTFSLGIIIIASSLDLLLGRLGRAVDDEVALLVERGKLGKVFLLEL